MFVCVSTLECDTDGEDGFEVRMATTMEGFMCQFTKPLWQRDKAFGLIANHRSNLGSEKTP